MKIQKLNNSKLFYKKWPYRVECIQEGGGYILHRGINNVKQWCQDKNGWKPVVHDSARLLEFIDAVGPYLNNKNLQFRTEGKHFNIFCADYHLLENINRDLGKWIVKISGPTTQEEYDFLMREGNRKILCNKLPYNKFKYKVIFNINFAEEKRENFLKWIENYKEKISMASSTKIWLSTQRKYIYHPTYIYVIDDKTTMLLSLYLGNNIKSIVEYVSRDMMVEV